jgi:hypothetical protein
MQLSSGCQKEINFSQHFSSLQHLVRLPYSTPRWVARSVEKMKLRHYRPLVPSLFLKSQVYVNWNYWNTYSQIVVRSQYFNSYLFWPIHGRIELTVWGSQFIHEYTILDIRSYIKKWESDIRWELFEKYGMRILNHFLMYYSQFYATIHHFILYAGNWICFLCRKLSSNVKFMTGR